MYLLATSTTKVRDFIIAYANYGTPDTETTRLLAYWVNSKFSKFHSILVAEGLAKALRVQQEFSRSDDTLIALCDLPSTRSTPQSQHELDLTTMIIDQIPPVKMGRGAPAAEVHFHESP